MINITSDTLKFINLAVIKIFSVNPLYPIVNSAKGHFKEKKCRKILDLADKYEEVWSGIRSEIKTLNGGKKLFYEKN